jgi:TatD DNase family protein
MEIIDTHCHLDVPEFDDDRSGVLCDARRRGVAAIVVPGIRRAGWHGLLHLCHEQEDLFPALGLHPLYLNEHRVEDVRALEALIGQTRLVAVGEIGLDYYRRELDRERQQTLFEAQLRLAQDAGLPVILHVRKAHDQVLETLRRIKVVGGIAHAFNGSLQQAGQYMELGFKLGFGGMLTYERSRRLRALARALPAEALVLETDAPDMTVMQYRGQRNSPAYLPYCLEALAEVRGEEQPWLAQQTSRNARAILHLAPSDPVRPPR